MNQFLLYARSRWATEKRSILLHSLAMLLVLPAFYTLVVIAIPKTEHHAEIAKTLSFIFVLSWTWAAAIRGLSHLRHPRRGIFYAMLPVSWGTKFTYHALAGLVVVPILLWTVRWIHHTLWFDLTTGPSGLTNSQFWLSIMPLNLITLLCSIGALFFMIGAVAGKRAWVWCSAILIGTGLAGTIEDICSSQWLVVRTLIDYPDFSTTQIVIMWGCIVLFLAIAARAVRKLEVR